jgi:hypothetical protein
VAFHESFWVATSAAAPVIVLAAVVALPESSTSFRTVSALRFLASLDRTMAATRRKLAEMGGDTSTMSLTDMLKISTEAGEDTSVSLAAELDEMRRTLSEPPWDRLYALAMVNRWLSFANVITQAGLLAVSLAALAYGRDVVPPLVAIILGVGGILLLAWTSVAGATMRGQWENWEPDQMSNLPPKDSSQK